MAGDLRRYGEARASDAVRARTGKVLAQTDRADRYEQSYWWGTTSEGSSESAVWRNPGDGFETGCVDWTPFTVDSCVAMPPGLVGYAFWLIGQPVGRVFAGGFEAMPPLPPLQP